MRDWLIGAAIALCAAVAVVLAPAVRGRDLDGRYANSALKPWFDALNSENGLCCSFADGVTITDAQWDTSGDHYRVSSKTAGSTCLIVP